MARIRVEGGRAAGVTLASGEALDAAAVVATGDPKRTFLELIAPGTLPIRIEDEYRRIRMRGTAAKLHLALDGPLELAARPGERFESIRIGGGHVDDLERAFDAVKYREVSAQPHLEVRVPTVADPASPRRATTSSRSSPATLPTTSTAAGPRSAAPRSSNRSSRRSSATLPACAAGSWRQELLTPADLEARYALTGGQLHHGEPALDQMLVLRPTPSAARYATSVPGLYLGGSGSHAGGGVTCTAGWLAAEAALR